MHTEYRITWSLLVTWVKAEGHKHTFCVRLYCISSKDLAGYSDDAVNYSGLIFIAIKSDKLL